MPGKFAVTGTQNAAAAAISLLAVGSGATTTCRCGVYYLGLGSVVTAAADAAMQFTVRRTTSLGTCTGVTPVPLDFDDFVAKCIAGENHTVEPTLAGVAFLELGMNQRATFQYQAAPGSEFWAERAKSSQVCITIVDIDAGTPEFAGTMHFQE